MSPKNEDHVSELQFSCALLSVLDFMTLDIGLTSCLETSV